MGTIFAESRDPAELLDLWVGWRTVSPPMRSMYERFGELVNAGARELGFAARIGVSKRKGRAPWGPG